MFSESPVVQFFFLCVSMFFFIKWILIFPHCILGLGKLPSLKLTASLPLKMDVVGRQAFPFGARPIFWGLDLLVLGRVYTIFLGGWLPYHRSAVQAAKFANPWLFRNPQWVVNGSIKGICFGFWQLKPTNWSDFLRRKLTYPLEK